MEREHAVVESAPVGANVSRGVVGAVLGALATVAPIGAAAGLLCAWERYADVQLPVTWLVVGLLVVRQLTALTLTVQLHRGAAHRQLDLHPALELVLRVWNFFFQGSTRVWAVMHRLHHKYEDTDRDPHSPVKPGGSLWNIFQQTSVSYFAVARALRDGDSLARFDVGTPRDAFERFALSVSARGPVSIVLARIPLLLAVLTLAFGAPVAVCLLGGLIGSIWGSTIVAINGFSHRLGYRLQEGGGHAGNLLPVDVVGCGEFLHHNHHVAPGRVDFAVAPFEFDPGYLAVVVLERLGLARRTSTR